MTGLKFEKGNHHYVPQYWQRGFRGNNGQLFGRIGNSIKVVSTKNTMQQDWLYTIFDADWHPSDALEDAISAVEAQDAELIRRLHSPSYVTTTDDRAQLCSLLALQACRHPDVLKRGQKLSRELGALLADVHSYSLQQFQTRVGKFGLDDSEAYNFYVVLQSRTKEQLAEELDALIKLSPQSSQIPAQDAIRAWQEIEATISCMQLCLLDALPPMAYVLGDTPIPQSDLSLGFSVPLSQSLAVVVYPTDIPQSLLCRRKGIQKEIDDINRTQYENALKVVVGPSAQLLNNLGVE